MCIPLYPQVFTRIRSSASVRGAGINQLISQDGHSIVKYTTAVLQNKYDLGIRDSDNSSLNSYLAEKKQSHPAETAGSVHKQSAGGYSRGLEGWNFQPHCRPWRQPVSPPPSRRSPRAGTGTVASAPFRAARLRTYRLRTQCARARPGPTQNRRQHVSQRLPTIWLRPLPPPNSSKAIGP